MRGDFVNPIDKLKCEDFVDFLLIDKFVEILLIFSNLN